MTAASAGGSPGRGLSRLELLALAYLAAPLVIFFVAWPQWPVATGLMLLLALSAVTAWRRRQRDTAADGLPGAVWLALVAAALAWVVAAGLLGPLPLNEDWAVRMLVLRDLVVGDWPVGYGASADGELWLRFSMGYYLVPAAFGKVLGLEGGRVVLGLWTALGALLFFALVISSLRSRRGLVVAGMLTVLVGFSGMDIVGWLLSDRPGWPSYGQHIEWWARWFQYSSQTTLLFWAPNHALPAWFAAALVWRHREQGLDMPSMALVLLACCWWSPLAALGMTPLLVACSLRGVGLVRGLLDGLHPAVLATLPGAALVARFVTFGVPQKVVDTAQAMTELQISIMPMLVPLVSRFALIEWALFGAVLVAAAGGWRRCPWWLWLAMAELLLLPALRFGPGNDVVMRGGIAPLTLLVIATAVTVTANDTARRWRLALIGLLLVGAATPLTELQRATLPGSQWPDDGRHVVSAIGEPWHYVGALAPGTFQDLLRSPRPPAAGSP